MLKNLTKKIYVKSDDDYAYLVVGDSVAHLDRSNVFSLIGGLAESIGFKIPFRPMPDKPGPYYLDNGEIRHVYGEGEHAWVEHPGCTAHYNVKSYKWAADPKDPFKAFRVPKMEDLI